MFVDGKVNAEPLYLAAVTFLGQGNDNELYGSRSSLPHTEQ